MFSQFCHFREDQWILTEVLVWMSVRIFFISLNCTGKNVILIVRNEVAEVMFLPLVFHSVHGGGHASVYTGIPPPTPPYPREQPPPGPDTPWIRHLPLPGTPPDQAPPQSRPIGPDIHIRHLPPADGYCCGRYASYWNAYLLQKFYWCILIVRYLN